MPRIKYHEGLGRGLEPEQAVQLRIGLALFGEDFSIKRRFGREMLEQQPFGNRGRRRDALGRGAGKAVTGKATLRGTQINCRRRSLVMRRVLIL